MRGWLLSAVLMAFMLSNEVYSQDTADQSQQRESQIVVSTTVYLPDVQVALNEIKNQQSHEDLSVDEEYEYGVKFRVKGVLDIGNIEVHSDENHLLLSVPFNLNGNISKGYVGAPIKAKGKYNVRFNPYFTNTWRVGLQIYNYDPDVEEGSILGIPMKSLMGWAANKYLAKNINNFADQQLQKLDEPKEMMEDVWAALHVGEKLPDLGFGDFYASNRPLSFCQPVFKSVANDNNRILINCGIKTSTLISDEKLPEVVKGQLPAPGNLGSEDSCKLNIPISLRYDNIAEILKKQLGGREYMGPSDVKFTIEDAQIKKEEGKLHIGVKVKVKMPWYMFDSRGWVWLKGEPELPENGHVVKFGKFDYEEHLDSLAISIADLINHDSIRKQAEPYLLLDYEEYVNQGVAIVKESVNDLRLPYHYKANIEPSVVRISDVALNKNGLIVGTSINQTLKIGK